MIIRCRSTSLSSSSSQMQPSSSSSSSISVDCVVVGAGISGLCTAQALRTRHPSLLVTEARDRVGGNITTVHREDGYLWEEGPNSFQPSDAVLSAVVDCGLKDDLVLGDPNAPRFVLWQGKLRPVPASLADLPFFDLMSIPESLGPDLGPSASGLRRHQFVFLFLFLFSLLHLSYLFSSLLLLSHGPPSGEDPFQGREESVEEFVRRNLGGEVFERLIEPFCSGVYAGDPSKLSMKAAFGKVWKLEQNGGSIIAGSFKAIQESRKNPMPPRDPLGNKVKLSWKLSSIQKMDQGYFLSYETPEGLMAVKAKSVILTVPSYVASSLLRPLSNEASSALAKFYYPPVAAVTLSYSLDAIKKECLRNGELQGFGQLHPRSQGVQTLGTIYSSSLFPNRAPPGRVLLLNYIGGATNTGIVSKTEGKLVEAVDHDLRKMLINPNAEDPIILGVRIWPQAIPQFAIGHLDRLEAARKALHNGGYKGIFLGGNYVAGVALGRCIERAKDSAIEVSEFLAEYANN